MGVPIHTPIWDVQVFRIPVFKTMTYPDKFTDLLSHPRAHISVGLTHKSSLAWCATFVGDIYCVGIKATCDPVHKVRLVLCPKCHTSGPLPVSIQEYISGKMMQSALGQLGTQSKSISSYCLEQSPKCGPSPAFIHPLGYCFSHYH